MSEQKVLCPYCGTVMILERGHESGLSYSCPNCWSESPFIKYKGGEDTKAICYEAALRRPLQKPLTLEELHALIDPGDEVVTYCEAKNRDDDLTYAHIWRGNLVVYANGDRIAKNAIIYDRYGKTWRAWATRPTDEERASAPWEE